MKDFPFRQYPEMAVWQNSCRRCYNETSRNWFLRRVTWEE
ncbi:hypothetical protein CLOM621_05809 [Clostridium sp. M62/1]|nr:hypothetical protein CLOM621_05809 [Clostridium sp. M62/1]